MTDALQVEGLASGYGTSEVVSDVSFALAKSEVLAIVGRNGMGKTSLLKTVLGFLPAWRGTIKLSGKDVTRMPPHLKRRLGLVYVPQEQALWEEIIAASPWAAQLLSPARTADQCRDAWRLAHAWRAQTPVKSG